GIIIRGAAESPSYLLIEDGVPALADAASLWGMDTAQATDVLKARHGADARVAVIGPGGERLVRFASIVTERTHPAARMGLGAVMGSKNLKGIVVVGGEVPRPLDPDLLAALTERYRSQMLSNELTRSQYEAPGFGGWIAEGDVTGYAGGVQNFRTSRLPDLSGLTRERLTEELFEDVGTCPGCPNNCIKVFANSLDSRAGGLHEETFAAFALVLGITDLSTLLDLNSSCYLWGVDPVSLAFAVAFACELGDRSLIGPDQLGGPVPAYGEVKRLVALLEAVALRHDPVAWLSDGVRLASRSVGPASEPSAMEVKGLEMVPYDPRSSAGQALAWAVSPLGPRYEIVEHDIDFDPVVGYPHALDQMKTLGYGEWAEMSELDATRVARTNALLEMWSG
ncbi:MAG TPA: aldehyde ferredoxin oxidoreductase C-terminal domain-containing protein, partial [Isosphaeraceae bacterium]|nr:aldehyde ferredoxin oxidoreductase C-terminal domain-containing protein [Isosphaeraceae bacterium]